jgi:protein-S-isoprenylcysteine O-methyltransferase Ste14
MSDDYPFRALLILGSLVFFPVGVYYRVKSQSTGESLDRWQEGPFILFTLRSAGLAYVVGLMAYMIDPASMAWSSMPLPAWLRWIGAGVGAIAGCLLSWTFRNLGKNLTDTVVTRREHTLVTTGPYRWVRHPFYDAVVLSAMGSALTAANWFLGVTGGLLFLLMAVRSRIEEEKLLLRFGDPYRAYVARTGRFLPRVGRTART